MTERGGFRRFNDFEDKIGTGISFYGLILFLIISRLYLFFKLDEAAGPIVSFLELSSMFSTESIIVLVMKDDPEFRRTPTCLFL